MYNNDFKDYVIEMKRIGLDNGQIARNLGMELRVFEEKCEELFQDSRKNQETLKKPTVQKLITEKPVSGVSVTAPRAGQVHPGVFEVPQGD